MSNVLAAATQPNGALALVLLVVAVAAGYWISIQLRPYTHCRRCSGGGKDRGEVFTHAFRNCRHCDGTGRTLRLGARLLGKRPR